MLVREPYDTWNVIHHLIESVKSGYMQRYPTAKEYGSSDTCYNKTYWGILPDRRSRTHTGIFRGYPAVSSLSASAKSNGYGWPALPAAWIPGMRWWLGYVRKINHASLWDSMIPENCIVICKDNGCYQTEPQWHFVRYHHHGTSMLKMTENLLLTPSRKEDADDRLEMAIPGRKMHLFHMILHEPIRTRNGAIKATYCHQEDLHHIGKNLKIPPRPYCIGPRRHLKKSDFTFHK